MLCLIFVKKVTLSSLTDPLLPPKAVSLTAFSQLFFDAKVDIKLHVRAFRAFSVLVKFLPFVTEIENPPQKEP